ncbi:ATP-grasp domain-containing protein [Actinokineospora sp. 24-640]
MEVLYLGWWAETADALARHGCDTTFVVGPADADAPGRVVVVPDPERLDDVVAALLREGIDPAAFAVVTSEHEECLVPAAVLAAAYGRPGLPVPTAVALRDKAVQKALVREAGLPVARCRTITRIEELAETDLPCVVKPLAGSSTKLTFAVRDRWSLELVTRQIAASGRPGPWLVEEFMSGTELHVDGVVRGGTVLFAGVSRYLQNVIEIQHGGLVGSVTVDPSTQADLYAEVHRLTGRALSALGHTDGVFHLELFDDGGRLAFSECAGRIGGGMVLETTRAKFGVDLYDEWVRAILGRPSALAPAVDPRPFGWVQLTAPPGRITAMPTPDEVRARPGVVALQTTLSVGDTVPDTTAASNARAGRVVMAGTSEFGLAHDLRALVAWFHAAVHTERARIVPAA